MHITVIICTHNRADFLLNTLESIYSAEHPENTNLDILVIANACTDNTIHSLELYARENKATQQVPLRWSEEKTPGKSYALNHAISQLSAPIAIFIDDDQRLDRKFFTATVDAINKHPDISIFCGKLVPDWDGNEPRWVHDTGKYRVYPPPIACFDEGSNPKGITLDDTLPPGGDLVIYKDVFQRVGLFSTELGPRGHDLLGGEDSNFIMRALRAGERIMYIPDIVQYHYVDSERLRLGHLIRKSYQRSRSIIRIKPRSSHKVPLYMWHKVAIYIGQTIFSLSWVKSRFFLIRLAAALGEIRGIREAALDTDNN